MFNVCYDLDISLIWRNPQSNPIYVTFAFYFPTSFRIFWLGKIMEFNFCDSKRISISPCGFNFTITFSHSLSLHSPRSPENFFFTCAFDVKKSAIFDLLRPIVLPPLRCLSISFLLAFCRFFSGAKCALCLLWRKRNTRSSLLSSY